MTRAEPSGLRMSWGDFSEDAPVKLALSMLCENPLRKTGLTTLFHEFISHSLSRFPDISWLVFAGPSQEWKLHDPRLELVRRFPANDRLGRRLLADHFQVPALARIRGADALLTVGFVPARKCLPAVMHLFSLQHLDKDNRVGFARRLYRHWVMRYSWPRADLVITNSQFAVAQILSVYPAFQRRMVQSYEGLQHEQFHGAPGPDEVARLQRHFGIQPGYFLWLSNFYPYKQADLLLQGYARLSAETRRRHPLVMVGGDWENTLEKLHQQAQSLNIAENIKFLGWIDDEWLAPFYRQALAFCLASREETFGRCVIEAMACGTPCLVNDIPIMQEVTAGHALIVNYRDATQVARALEQLAHDAARTARLREEGLARAAHFTFEKLTDERIQAIQRLLAGDL